MEPFIEQFLSLEEGAARAAAKRLTATIERELIGATVNAPDWYVGLSLFIFFFFDESPKLTVYRDTLYCARMTRELLWENERLISLDEFAPVTQTCVSAPCLLTRFLTLYAQPR